MKEKQYLFISIYKILSKKNLFTLIKQAKKFKNVENLNIFYLYAFFFKY